MSDCFALAIDAFRAPIVVPQPSGPWAELAEAIARGDMIALPEKRLRNQCVRCLWMAPWETLVGTIWLNPLYDEETFARIGVEIVRHYEHVGDDCTPFHKPNLTRRARPRCPECGHGSPAGHKGRACPAYVSRGSWDGYEDVDSCGCTYRAPQVTP